MNQRKALCVVFCGICVVMTPAVHASADDLATYLEATLGSVRTLSLDFNQTSSEMRLENMTGKFIAVLDVGRVIRMRSTLITPLGPEELIIKDGKHIGLRGKTRTYTVNTELETAAAWGTPLFYASWVTRIKDKPYFGAILSSLHEQPYTTVDPPSAAHRPDALFYSTKYDDTVQLLGFSPAHNYLPCYRRLTPIGTEDWAEDRFEHFAEVVKGIYFPTAIIRTILHPQTKQEKVSRIVFANIRINESIPDSAFDIKYAEGDRIVDAIAKRVYVAGKDGVPRDDKKMQYFDSGTRRDSVTGETVTASATDPRSWPFYFWVSGGAILVLLATLLTWFIVSRSRRKGVRHA